MKLKTQSKFSESESKIQCKCNKFYSQDMMTQFFVTYLCFSNICSVLFQHYIDFYILRVFPYKRVAHGFLHIAMQLASL